MVAHVLIEISNIDKTFTYLIPSDLKAKVGCRCLVPFGNRCLEGFIIKIDASFDCDYELKHIIELVDDTPVLNKELLDLGYYLSKKTLCTLTSAYQTMLPRALKARSGKKINKKKILYLKKISDYEPTNDKEKVLLDLLENKDISLKEASDVSKYTVDKLIQKGVIEKYLKEVYRLDDSIIISKEKKVLTAEQINVIQNIHLNTFKPYLLHGVTGSGKTEVYMQVIEKVLKEGKEVIMLVPEISLTPQLVDTFKKRFGNQIALLHSRLSNGEKYDEWRKIVRQEVSIVIGARSAVFAPLTNIGVIIIDEEHSSTYKQENNPRYNAIDLALYRARKYNCPLVLGTATPSIESYTKTTLGVYQLLEMKKRINDMFPQILLVDMKKEMSNRNYIFSDILKTKINETLTKKEQVILLLNRRGFTTIIQCRNCGSVHKCPKCDIPLIYHLKENIMKCHYCNYVTKKINICPTCKSNEINERGMGTEKLEQEVLKSFPKARVLRMDIDTTQTKNAHQKILNSFKNEDYNILIGTQMIAKGLDFPKVTLVGVINGDATLNIPDFRSGERTFQLLSQVAGRSGRSDLNGSVIIQAFNTDHYSLIYAKNNDYLSFYRKEMSIRKQLQYPPFYNLCLIKIQGINDDDCKKEGLKIVKYLKEHLKDEIILGPTPAIIPKINTKYFYQIIIKFKDTKKIYNNLKFINDQYRKGKVNVSIDFNPIKI